MLRFDKRLVLATAMVCAAAFAFVAIDDRVLAAERKKAPTIFVKPPATTTPTIRKGTKSPKDSETTTTETPRQTIKTPTLGKTITTPTIRKGTISPKAPKTTTTITPRQTIKTPTLGKTITTPAIRKGTISPKAPKTTTTITPRQTIKTPTFGTTPKTPAQLRRQGQGPQIMVDPLLYKKLKINWTCIPGFKTLELHTSENLPHTWYVCKEKFMYCRNDPHSYIIKKGSEKYPSSQAGNVFEYTCTVADNPKPVTLGSKHCAPGYKSSAIDPIPGQSGSYLCYSWKPQCAKNYNVLPNSVKINATWKGSSGFDILASYSYVCQHKLY